MTRSSFTPSLDRPAHTQHVDSPTGGLLEGVLKDKPTSIRVYIENFIDDTRICSRNSATPIETRVLDLPRCWDALANSSINLLDWLATGQAHRPCAPHNNDGIEDKHWPLGQGVLDMASVIESLLDHTEASTDLVLECNLEKAFAGCGRIVS
jgi:hypothetical protein